MLLNFLRGKNEFYICIYRIKYNTDKRNTTKQNERKDV